MQEKYTKIWEEFNKQKAAYEEAYQLDNAQQEKTDRIAAELYKFINTQLKAYKILGELGNDIPEWDKGYQFWQLLNARSMVSIFTGLLSLAFTLKAKKEVEREAMCKGIEQQVRQLSDVAQGHKDVWWGSIKLGIPGVIILGIIAGLVAATILVNPVFFVYLAIFLPLGGIVGVCIFTLAEDPFKDFHNTGFSKELYDLADRIQAIIDGTDLGPAPTQLQGQEDTPKDSFGPVYQPAPEETPPLANQDISHKTGPNL